MSPDRSLKGPFQILMNFLAERPVSRWQRIPTLEMQSLEALPHCSTRYPPQQLFWSQSWVSGEVREKPEASIWWHWQWDFTQRGGKSHFWLKQAENEESADPDVPTKGKERFLSHEREWESPDLPPPVRCCSLHKAWAHAAPSTCTKELLQFSPHSLASWKHS